MKIVEYKLHPSPAGMKCPDFIDDGGYWGNPADHTMIGLIPSDVEYYVPDSIIELTAVELETRQLAIHAIYPMYNMEEERNMTTTEVKTSISGWISYKE
jgi:hypothetical protein